MGQICSHSDANEQEEKKGSDLDIEDELFAELDDQHEIDCETPWDKFQNNIDAYLNMEDLKNSSEDDEMKEVDNEDDILSNEKEEDIIQWLNSYDSFHDECCRRMEENSMNLLKNDANNNNNKKDTEKKKKYHKNFFDKLKVHKPKFRIIHKIGKKMKEMIDKDKKWFKKQTAKIGDIILTMLRKFLNKLWTTLVNIMTGIEILIIGINDLYHIIQSLPILNKILPAHIPQDDVLPPRDKNTFANWALTIEYKTKNQKYLKTVDDVKNLIKEAKDSKGKCRFAAYAHSFSPMFGDENTFTGRTIDLKYHGLNPPLDSFDDLQEYSNNYNTVTIKDHPLMYIHCVDNKIKLGGATSNINYTKWMQDRWTKNAYQLTPSEPCNVLQHYQCYGGTHAVGCHGAGITTTNVPYYIKEMIIINSKGEEITYDKGDLKKMTTHFGLLGFVKEMTLQYDEMYIAKMKPFKIKIDEYLNDVKRVQSDISNNYYNEIFWFTGNDDLYVNVWKQRILTHHDPNNKKIKVNLNRGVLTILANQLNQIFNMICPLTHPSGLKGKIMSCFVSTLGMSALPTFKAKEHVNFLSCDALHFIHGIQEARVLDVEWSVPLKVIKNYKLDDGTTMDVPDVSRAIELIRACMKLNKEWSTGKSKRYPGKNMYPQLLPLELRIIKGSDMHFTVGYNVPFCCTIEVLTIAGTKEANDIFYQYAQDLTDIWAGIAGEDVKYMRPHWGKIWQNLTIQGTYI